jgi:hypothetical protein
VTAEAAADLCLDPVYELADAARAVAGNATNHRLRLTHMLAYMLDALTPSAAGEPV